MGPSGRLGAHAATGMFLFMRPPVPLLGATMITTTTAAMLGAVVAGVALAPAMLSPAVGSEPGMLDFTFDALCPGMTNCVNDIAVGPDGGVVVIGHKDTDDGGSRVRHDVFHSNGTLDFSFRGYYGGEIGVAVGPDGRIVMAPGPVRPDYLRVFHPNGTHDNATNLLVYGGHKPPSDDGYRYGSHVAVGPDGRIFAGQYDSVRVYHSNGTLDTIIGGYLHDLNFVGPIAVAPNGSIAVVTDYRGHRGNSSGVQIFHSNGTFASTFGVFPHLRDIDFGPSGEFVTVGREGLSLFLPNGTLFTSVDRPNRYAGAYGSVAVGPTGTIFVTHVNMSVIEVRHGFGLQGEWPGRLPLSPPAPSPPAAGMPYVPPVRGPSLTSGTLAFEFGSYGQGPGEFLAPHNIAFGPGGIIAVSDATNHRIQLFHPNGTFAFELGSRGSGPGELQGPYGLAFGPNGLLAVSDIGNHRVQVFRIQ